MTHTVTTSTIPRRKGGQQQQSQQQREPHESHEVLHTRIDRPTQTRVRPTLQPPYLIQEGLCANIIRIHVSDLCGQFIAMNIFI